MEQKDFEMRSNIKFLVKLLMHNINDDNGKNYKLLGPGIDSCKKIMV